MNGVVLYCDDHDHREVQRTIVTDTRGPRAGQRVVRGREAECRTLYATVDPITRSHFLWDEATAWSQFDLGQDSRIHRRYLDEEIEVIPTPGLHHAFVVLPDGTLAWGAQEGLFEDEETLMELAPGALEPTVLWSVHDWPVVQDWENWA